MTHDPLCPYVQTAHQRDHVACHCDLIAKVREDEQLKQYEAQSGNWEDGYFHGIAKCIAALPHAHNCWANYPEQADACTCMAAITRTELQALREKP
jgi:hypothetical protein